MYSALMFSSLSVNVVLGMNDSPFMMPAATVVPSRENISFALM